MTRWQKSGRREFEDVVAAALEGVPENFRELLQNIIVKVEDEPLPDDYELTGIPEDEEILGIYRGSMLTERSFDSLPELPAQIVIFKNPILRCTETRQEAIQEIRETVMHELGHYFGLEDEEMPF
ncbi:MAG: metallopeptidase family protein [Acidobacteria bacterium]|nr:metallopeptidase family protein [Acidobacteriota bacterium]